MAGISFTEEQSEVIRSRDQSLLVSAAAGSGKTAVLVQRILKRISGENAVDIDRMIIVTFTKAAAYEMKERIAKALSDALYEDPFNKNLRRQEVLLHNADITTIDSFCQRIVKDHIGMTGLEPGFRVAEEGEIRVLLQETIDALLEEKYAEGGADFLAAMDYFAPGPGDKSAENILKELHAFAMKEPDPEGFLDACIERADDPGDMCEQAVEAARVVLADAVKILEDAKLVAVSSDGPEMYEETLDEDTDELTYALSQIEADASYDSVRAAIHAIEFVKLKAARGFDGSPEKKEAVANIRKRIKKEIEELREKLFIREEAEEVAVLAETAAAVRGMCVLAKELAEAFAQRKQKENLIDFNDMEHFALRILDDPDVRAEYREHYEEVMVDEYQDVSALQEGILRALSRSADEEGYDRFMVGDVKQSIYRFRGARPEIFAGALSEYQKGESEKKRRIDLHRNFRSRGEVIDFVNGIFSGLMRGDIGGVDYDEDAYLKQGASFPGEGADGRYDAEVVLIDEEDAEEKGITEARFVAKRIRELKEEGRFSYGDMVILMRSASGTEETCRRILEEEGIPSYVESRSGYFQATEIMQLISLLKVLNNPLHDIPLIAAMHSPMFSFTDEELAKIRVHELQGEARRSFYYEAVTDYALQGEEEALREKTASFVACIDALRELARISSATELIREIFARTGFDLYVAALPGGERRVANLNLLVHKAAVFEESDQKGLFRFVRYLEQLHKYEVDAGEANVIDESADVVRIMTIHKSKGLEFPVVFLTGTGRQFNMSDTTGVLLLDTEETTGVQLIRPDLRIRSNTLRHRLIARKKKAETLGEEMRILYVALTRAKEKLIITGSVKDAEKTLHTARMMTRDETGVLPFTIRMGARCYLDWMLPLIDRTLEIEVVDAASIEKRNIVEAVGREIRKEQLRTLSPEMTDPALFETLTKRFHQTYAHPEYARLFTKTTVTELKEARMREEGEEAFTRQMYEDASLRQAQGPQGAAQGPQAAVGELVEPPPASQLNPDVLRRAAFRGTCYHKAMELIDPGMEAQPEAIDAFLQREELTGRAPAGFAETVNAADIATFLRTDLCARMKEAAARGELYREKQFMLGVDADTVDETLPQEEMVLIQGIIDCFFYEGDGIVLIDYKTDRGADADTLKNRYRVQMEHYDTALRRLTGKTVKERIIYAFQTGEVIPV